MKVLHVNLATAGIGRYGLLLDDALHSVAGITTRSVCRDDAGLREFAAMAKIRHPDRWLQLKGWRDRAAAVWSLRETIRTFRPDMIHDSGAMVAFEAAAAWWPRRHGVATLLTVHDPTPHRGMARSPHKVLVRRGAMSGRHDVLVHGPWCRAAAIDRGIPPDRVHVVPHGTLAAFLGAGPDIERVPGRILVFGELRPNKGVAWLPQIAAALASEVPQAHLWIAGNAQLPPDLARSEWARELDEILADLRARRNVHVAVGFVPDDQVGALFRSSDLCLLPYEAATQSGVALVALPAGAVPVATNVGDIPAVVRDGDTGYLAAAVDPAAIARRIREALADRAALEAVRARGMAAARAEWSWTTVAAQTVAVYRQVLAAS